MSSKDIAKYNRDMALSENVNRLEAFANNLIDKSEKYIKKTSKFFSAFDRGKIPQDILYTEILFRNILNVPFCDEEHSEDLENATNIIFSLTSFPTIVPEAFERAAVKYMKTFVRAINSNNRNMIQLVFGTMTELLNKLHEHEGYETPRENDKERKPLKDKFKKEKKFREVDE